MEFYYGAADSLGILFQEEFGESLPHKALALAAAAVLTFSADQCTQLTSSCSSTVLL
jgi:hypothetical protein